MLWQKSQKLHSQRLRNEESRLGSEKPGSLFGIQTRQKRQKRIEGDMSTDRSGFLHLNGREPDLRNGCPSMSYSNPSLPSTGSAHRFSSFFSCDIELLWCQFFLPLSLGESPLILRKRFCIVKQEVCVIKIIRYSELFFPGLSPKCTISRQNTPIASLCHTSFFAGTRRLRHKML